jgi:hypothetical protein
VPVLKGKRARKFVIVFAVAALVVAAIAAMDAIRQRAREKEIDAIIARLGDENQRSKAETELAAVTDGTGIRRIVWHLGDDDPNIRDEMVTIIGKIGAGAARPLAEMTFKSYMAYPAWLQGSPTLLRIYLGWRQEFPRSDYLRWWQNANGSLMEAYGKIGAPARGALIELASNVYMRARALQWLACIGDPRDLDLFITYLGDYPIDGTAAANAATGLGVMKYAREERRKANLAVNDAAWREFDARSGEAVQALVSAVASTEAYLRRSAAFALGNYWDNETAMAAVLGVIKNTEEAAAVRIAAASGLKHAEYPAAQQTLLALLYDNDREVRQAVVRTLLGDNDNTTPRAMAALLASTDSLVCESAISFFTGSWEEKNIPLLAQTYGSLDAAGRRNAIIALQRIRDGAYAQGRQGGEIVKKRARLQQAAEDAWRDIHAQDNAPIAPDEPPK